MPITTDTVLILWSFYGLVTVTAFIVLGVEFAVKEFRKVAE